jgi:Domain of unknown function (DUF4386)
MTTQIATGLLLLVLPVAYNVLFAVLARTFDYPDILRQPTTAILGRFTKGGSRLILTWWAFAMTAALLAPAVVLLSNTVLDANATVLALATTFGVLAAAVQFLGLIRWPLAVPYLARTAADPAADRATEAAVEVTFQTLNRYLGVAVGEHLGYLFTGLWTAFAGLAIVQSELLNPAVGAAGIAIAPLFVLGAAEFVGPFEPRGWKVSATLVPIAYVGWSIWLLTVGAGLLVAA